MAAAAAAAVNHVASSEQRREASRDEVMLRIERLVSHCVQAVSRGRVPEIRYPSPIASTALSPSGVLQRNRAEKMCEHTTTQRMADLLALALSAYSILSAQQQRTLRDVYYDNVHQGTFASQDRVNAATRLLCDVLNVPRWRLGLVGSFPRAPFSDGPSFPRTRFNL